MWDVECPKGIVIVNKERPILFSGDMVRAILEGRKSQTRWPVKPQPAWRDVFMDWLWRGFHFAFADEEIFDSHGTAQKCPYGQTGDWLWVRETWHHSRDKNRTYFRADAPGADHLKDWKWKPSIHMPRWASRILLEIVSVRMERIQDISEADAKAEGVGPLFSEKELRERPDIAARYGDDMSFRNYLWHGDFGSMGGGNKTSDAWRYQYSGYDDARGSFSSLWELTYGPGSWDRNDWVWAIEFKRI